MPAAAAYDASVARILLYTGKGGTGKTSIAAATALLSAKRGHRTIVLSTDIAHSLADAFDVPLGPEPTLIAPNLWGQEPDVYFNIGRYWATIQAYMTELFSWRGLDEVMAEEMTVLPGMDELGNLLWIADHVESGRYDLIVVDAAPTGETLRLLSLPEASRWWVDRIAPIGRRVSRISRPVLERMIGVPVPRDEVFAAAERLLGRLEAVHRRGAPVVHLLPPVRLSQRPGHRQPGDAGGRRRRLFRGAARDPAGVPAHGDPGLRAGAAADCALLRPGDGRRRQPQ
jgi:anion-transporting  ArsA/GET3 family ATPase